MISPVLIVVWQEPQPPARQPESTVTPLASANSSRLPPAGRQEICLPERAKVTVTSASRGGTCLRRRVPALERRRAERLEMDARGRHAPAFQRRHEAFQHRRRAADIELERLQRQLQAQQCPWPSAAVPVAADVAIRRHRTNPPAAARCSISADESSGALPPVLEVRQHDGFGAVAHAVEQPDLALTADGRGSSSACSASA